MWLCCNFGQNLVFAYCRQHCHQIFQNKIKARVCAFIVCQQLSFSHGRFVRENFFSDVFFRKVSCGSCGIKGICRIKEMQNESIRGISHCQMFYMKYSAICLFALFVVWCLLRCTHTSLWHESNARTLTDRIVKWAQWFFWMSFSLMVIGDSFKTMCWFKQKVWEKKKSEISYTHWSSQLKG